MYFYYLQVSGVSTYDKQYYIYNETEICFMHIELYILIQLGYLRLFPISSGIFI